MELRAELTNAAEGNRKYSAENTALEETRADAKGTLSALLTVAGCAAKYPHALVDSADY